MYTSNDHFLLQSLSHCELITDEGIRHLGCSPCATESMSFLGLDNCPLITDASLEYLMGCTNLQRIELYDCQLITRAGIRRLRVRVLCVPYLLTMQSSLDFIWTEMDSKMGINSPISVWIWFFPNPHENIQGMETGLFSIYVDISTQEGVTYLFF